MFFVEGLSFFCCLIISAQETAEKKVPLSCPRINEYMLRSPNTFRKYHDAELTLGELTQAHELEKHNAHLIDK